MTEDISDVVEEEYGIPTEKAREYAALLRPFSEKVHQGKPLSDEEIIRVDKIYNELRSTYGPKHILHPAFIGVKCISDLDWAIKKRLEEDELEKEAEKLRNKRRKKKKEGTFTPEEERWFYRRLEYIRSVIEPDYYFGPRISPDKFK